MTSIKVWGSRGSLASPAGEKLRYGGNTSCVEVSDEAGTVLVLDAGTGIRDAGIHLVPAPRVDLLLTHLHMDHVQGVGFFAPLFVPGKEVHIWGPASAGHSLSELLTRYLSPPLFPVGLWELPCKLTLHAVDESRFEVGRMQVTSSLVCHPGPTVGYRITTPDGVVTYMPDHEPALGPEPFPGSADWTSGFQLARDADLLIHDCQYFTHEYPNHIGWGHSSIADAFAFATLAKVRELVPFHHDPGHTDAQIDTHLQQAVAELKPAFRVTPGTEGLVLELK